MASHTQLFARPLAMSKALRTFGRQASSGEPLTCDVRLGELIDGVWKASHVFSVDGLLRNGRSHMSPEIRGTIRRLTATNAVRAVAVFGATHVEEHGFTRVTVLSPMKELPMG